MSTKQKNQSDEKQFKWSDTPKQYKSKIDEIDNPVIKNVYSKFTFKYYEINESQNNSKDDDDLVSHICNYLFKYKFIVFHLSKSIPVKDSSATNCIFCVEGECLIIEGINTQTLENIISKIKKERISLVNVGKNSNHAFDKIETDAKEEIQNFCEQFRTTIKHNSFVSYTIDSIVGYLIRRYYFPTNYFNEPSFFDFDQTKYSIEHEIKRSLDDCICGENNKIETVQKIENEIEKIRNSEDNVPKYKFKENEFIKIRTLYTKEDALIYLVIHMQTLHLFCMKIFVNQCLNDDENHEIKFSNYSHRCFVRCYGLLKKNDQTIGIIYEFMSNGSLNIYIRDNDSDDFYLLTCIVRIFSGIEYLQKHQQIHRDLKPSNILLDHDYLPYISDFETVKSVSTEKPNTVNIGSPSYSSPEQDKSVNISYPTDIYSFGLIIYFLYEKKDMFDIYSTKEGNKTMSKGTEDIQYISKKCIQNNPEERITCNDIKLKLDVILSSFSIYENYFLNEKTKINRTQIINFVFENTLILKSNESYFGKITIIRFFYNLKFSNNFSDPFQYYGYFYEKGKGVKQDYAKSIEYYEKSANVNNSFALFRLGILYEKGQGVKQDYAKSIEYYEKSANLNNSDALLKLGLLYETGQGVKQDYSKAIEYYEKSADLNNSDALHILGLHYELGEGVKQDYTKSIEYYEKSANLNDTDALYRLGLLYEFGKGVKQDYSKSIEYYEKSANLNNSDALLKLGHLYEEGLGVKQDYSKSIEYYEKSADLNNSFALFKLGLLYENGQVVKQDYSKSIEYYEKSANLNNSDALYNLGHLYEEGLGVKQDYSKSIEYYEESANLNNSDALFKLGLLYKNGQVVKQDYTKSIEYYEKSANLNNTDALNKLGRFYEFGKGVKQDYSKSIEYYEKSADLNNSDALFNLGHLYEFGKGVKQDYTKSIEYYEKSANLNNSRALYKLGLLFEFGKGVKQDYTKSIEYYKKSANLNDTDALNKLGRLYEFGKGVKQDYTKSIEYYEKSANVNNSFALLKLGYFYEEGLGVKQDYSKSIEYYEKSANLNNSRALYKLGLLFEFGEGVKQDYTKSIEYYEKSANLNDTDALYKLGRFYEFGKGVKQDYSKSIEYYEKSANLNDTDALNKLGLLYEFGKGVKQDYSKSIEYYEKSANLNNPYALYNLGLLYEKGQGVKKDYSKSIKYYEKSANLNNSLALYKLGVFYKNEYYYKRDYSKAKEYFEKSAELNNSEALNSLGSIYESGLGVEQNYDEALKYYKKSAKLDNSEAYLKIGYFYFNGYGVNKNYKKAIQSYEMSSYLNNYKANLLLGDIYSNNDKIEIDLNKAINYFQKSISIQSGLITTDYFDGSRSTTYKANDYRYISYNDIGLIYHIEKNEIEEATNNIKESAFAEYPFGQNNFGLLNEFYLNEPGNAEYMYKRSSKHNFSLAEFNLSRIFESEIKKSIEYLIRASDHEDEPLTYRGITRDDKRLQISKTFIICLTNLKLFIYYFTNDDYDESKKYFKRAFNKIITNTEDFKYQFKFIFSNQQENETKEEYSNHLFSYLKKFILNFPLFNLINQPNLDMKSYPDIFEQIEPIKETKEQNCEDDDKENNYSGNKKHLLINEPETKYKETDFINKEYEKQLSEMNMKPSKFKEKEYHQISCNISDIKEILNLQEKNDQNIDGSTKEKKSNEFEDPGELFDFIISNSIPEVTMIFIEEINRIIEIMNKILYTPPYPILFGRISIVKPKEKIKSTQINIDESFYEGFELE